MAAFLLILTASAQRPIEGWNAVAGVQKSVGDGGGNIADDKYYAINIGVGYKWYVYKNFNFNPEVRLVYRDFGKDYEVAHHDFLLSLRPTAAYNYKRLEVFTGPTVEFRIGHSGQTVPESFYPGRAPLNKVEWGTYPQSSEKRNGWKAPNTVVMNWQFGIGTNIEGLLLRAAFHMGVSKYHVNNRGMYFLEFTAGHTF